MVFAYAYARFGPAGRIRKLEIRQVWAHNVEREFCVIRYAAKFFPFVSMDTEFPGVVHDPFPNKPYFQLTPSENYDMVKANVDALHLIQVGLTFAASPNSPPVFAFQINLRDFDPRLHCHNPDSIDLLVKQGINFAAHRSYGVDGRVFAKHLMSSGLVCANNAVTWVTFSAGYDLGYLLKLLNDRELPETLPEFLDLVHVFFGDKLYDVKHMLCSCPWLPGGLEPAAEELGVAREAGMAHQAGSDSALTWGVFRRIRDVYFNEAGVEGFAGVVHSIGALPRRRTRQP